MEKAYFFVTAAFAGALLIYAGILYAAKSVDLIPKSQFADIKDKKKYAVQFAKLIAVIALAPLISGIISLFAPIPAALAVLVVGIVAAINAGRLLMKDVL